MQVLAAMPGAKQYLNTACELHQGLTLHQALKQQLFEMSSVTSRAGYVEPLMQAVRRCTADAALRSMAEQTNGYGPFRLV